LRLGGAKSKPFRDTKGPGIRGVQTMLAIAQDQDPEKAARDTAIIRLAYGLGLRRGEIEDLGIGHVNLEGSTLSLLGKGRTDREPMTLPLNTRQALAAWLSVRGMEDARAPLFIALDRAMVSVFPAPTSITLSARSLGLVPGSKPGLTA
jgi:integrase/recombinase XerC